MTKTNRVPGLRAVLISAHTARICYGMYVAKRKFQIEFDTHQVAVGGLLSLFIYTTLVPVTKIVNNSELKTAAEITQKIKLLAPTIKPLLNFARHIPL